MSAVFPLRCQACDGGNRIVPETEEAAHHVSRAQTGPETPPDGLAPDQKALRHADRDGLLLPALEGYPYMMTPSQVAEFVGMTPQGVRKLLSSGKLAGCHVGSAWRVPKLCLVRYLNGSRQEERT